mgnify:CR=1 FL=1
MIIIIILYLIGVFINCWFICDYLLDKYNKDKTIAVVLLKNVLICLSSWLHIIIILIIILVAWLCYLIHIFSNKPLFKKKK